MEFADGKGRLENKCSFCFLALREYINRCLEPINFPREEKLLAKIRRKDCFMSGEAKMSGADENTVPSLWGPGDLMLAVEWPHKAILWGCYAAVGERSFGSASYWFGDKTQ